MLICLITSKINRPLLIDAREQVEETVKVDRAWEVEKRFQLIAVLAVRTFDQLDRATTRLSMVVVARRCRGNGGAIGFKNRPANTTWSNVSPAGRLVPR